MWLNRKQEKNNKRKKKLKIIKEKIFMLLKLKYLDIEMNISNVILELETLSIASKKQQVNWWRFLLAKKRSSVLLIMNASLWVTEISLLNQLHLNVIKKCRSFIRKNHLISEAFSCIVTLFIRSSEDAKVRLIIVKKHLKLILEDILTRAKLAVQIRELTRLITVFGPTMKIFRKLILKKILSQNTKPKLFSRLIVLFGFKSEERCFLFLSSLKYSLYIIKKLGSPLMFQHISIKEIQPFNIVVNNVWHEFFISLMDQTIYSTWNIYPCILYIIEFLCSCLHWCLILPMKNFDFPLLETIKWMQQLADLRIDKEIIIYEYTRIQSFTNIVFQLLHYCFYASLNMITDLESLLGTKFFPILYVTIKILVTIQIFTTLIDDIILLKKFYNCLITGLNQLGINFAMEIVDFLLIIMKHISNISSLKIKFFSIKHKIIEVKITNDALKVINAFCRRGLSILHESIFNDLETLFLNLMFQIIHFSVELPFEISFVNLLISFINHKHYFRIASLPWILLFFQNCFQNGSNQIKKLSRKGLIALRRCFFFIF